MLQETLADLTLPAYSYRVPLVMTIWEQKGREVELTLIEVVLVGGGGWYICVCVGLGHSHCKHRLTIAHSHYSQSVKQVIGFPDQLWTVGGSTNTKNRQTRVN